MSYSSNRGHEATYKDDEHFGGNDDIPKVHTKRTASVEIEMSVWCGCGFKAKSGDEGKAHAMEKGHILNILGVIRPKYDG